MQADRRKPGTSRPMSGVSAPHSRDADMTLLRIIARRIPWPDPSARPNRSGLRPRWDALAQDGQLLVPATEHPLEDAAHVLMLDGADPDMPVTLHHEGAEHDSFVPMPLWHPALQGCETGCRTGAQGGAAPPSPAGDAPNRIRRGRETGRGKRACPAGAGRGCGMIEPHFVALIAALVVLIWIGRPLL